MTEKTTLTALVLVAVVVGAAGAGLGYMLANGAGPDALGAAGPRQRVVVAIQPTDSPSSIQAKADELEAFLEARTGLDVSILVPLTSTGTIEALRFGHAQVAMLGSWPARLAHDIAGAEVVLAEWREVIVEGKPVVAPSYDSYYVVQKDSPYTRLEDLKGLRVAYPSATSGSGYVYPLARLVERGLVPAASGGKAADPAAFFGQVAFAGGYAQAWQALKNGQVDVAVTAGDIPAALFREVMDGTRTIETQGPIPSHAVLFAKDFQGTEAAERLKAAFLELKGEHKELMRKLVSGIFVEFAPRTTEEHLGPLGAALDKVGLRMQEKL